MVAKKVEHKGAAPDARCDIEQVVTELVDDAMDDDGVIQGHGIKIVDAVDFGVDVE